jgi:hypothetical protein
MAENNLLVLPDWRLPHGWNILAGGYAIPPISTEGPPLDAYIVHRQAELSARERDDRN